jgi:acyl-CoA thioesterase-1
MKVDVKIVFIIAALATMVSLVVGGAPNSYAAAAAKPNAEIRLLVLGDSLAAGYGLPAPQSFTEKLQEALTQKGHAVRVINAGVSGDTSAGGRARLDWVLADKPHAAILELGANDGLRGLNVSAMRDNLAAILERFEAAGIHTLLAGMKAPPNYGGAYVRDYDAAFESLARANEEVIFYPFFLEGVAAVPELNQPDGIHPNAKGVEVVVRNILPAVEQLLARVRAAQTSNTQKAG